MSYPSVDQLQNTLGSTVFQHTKDAKKAAGRALGTIVEIISYYMIRQWGMANDVLIERSLQEYGNKDIAHNVEFSFHPSSLQSRQRFYTFPITSTALRKQSQMNDLECMPKKNNLIERDGLLRNACILAETNSEIYMANVADYVKKEVDIVRLLPKPYAMVECKRVGVEEGCKKGPQTIEKAKQGAYVARMTSSLQKIRNNQGEMQGIIYDKSGPIIKSYHELLDDIISKRDDLLKDFILSIGVVSNHGNWFTSNSLNKELRVLAQSYDWLLFLSDEGLAQFITDLLLSPSRKYMAVKEAFINSYKEGKKQNRFTKTKIDINAHVALADFFKDNIAEIESWFNIVTPEKAELSSLKRQLLTLKQKNWEVLA